MKGGGGVEGLIREGGRWWGGDQNGRERVREGGGREFNRGRMSYHGNMNETTWSSRAFCDVLIAHCVCCLKFGLKAEMRLSNLISWGKTGSFCVQSSQWNVTVARERLLTKNASKKLLLKGPLPTYIIGKSNKSANSLLLRQEKREQRLTFGLGTAGWGGEGVGFEKFVPLKHCFPRVSREGNQVPATGAQNLKIAQSG